MRYTDEIAQADPVECRDGIPAERGAWIQANDLAVVRIPALTEPRDRPNAGAIPMHSATHVDKPSRPADFYVPAATLPQGTHPPNLRAEATAVRELTRSLGKDPAAAARHLLDIARHLCGAGSAGLSLLRTDRADHTILQWQTVTGALAEQETFETPRHQSPCGLCLDTGISILITRPERVFHQLSAMSPAIAEVLTVPLLDNISRPLGTLWVAHHDGKIHFHGDHVRIVEQLAALLVLALKLQEHASDHRRALSVIESHQQAQQKLLIHDLLEERSLREQAELDHQQALRFKGAMIDEVNHRTKNSLQMVSTLLAMQARSSTFPQVREALQDSIARLQLLARAHELLDVNVDHKQRVFMPQLLESLGHALRQPSADVRLEIVSDPIELPAQDAVALALLANEAITNAYRHAFPNQSAGVILVKLQRTREHAVVLRIEDTGVGLALPNGRNGMGLKLIRTFAEQLNGTLHAAGRGAGMGTLIMLTIDAI
jgi:two-component sensor histidine kinase